MPFLSRGGLFLSSSEDLRAEENDIHDKEEASEDDKRQYRIFGGKGGDQHQRKAKDDGGEILIHHIVRRGGLEVAVDLTQQDDAGAARENVRGMVMSVEGVKEMHGFYIDPVDKTINYDVVLEFGVRSRRSLAEELQEKTLKLYPDYEVKVTVDYDFTDSTVS